MKFKSIDKIIKKYSTKIILCGYSEINKNIIKIYHLENKIKYIFDNNAKNINSEFKNIKIIDMEELIKLKDYYLILSGNHILSFYKQLKESTSNIIYIIKKTKNIGIFLNAKNFNIDIELPDYIENKVLDSSHIFAKKLLSYFVEYGCSIKTIPTKHNNKNYFRKRIFTKNTITVSYHSIDAEKSLFIYKEGYLKDMITLDSRGYSGWSSLCDTDIDKLLNNISQKKAIKFFDKFSKKYISNNHSKYIQPKDIKFTFPEKFIFFPLQTVNDSVMKLSYFKPLILIENIIKILARQNIPLVIKKHPKCNNKNLELLLNKYLKKNEIIIYNGSIHKAISKANTIYTINSGVGFEALLHLKPVITFGKSDYMFVTKNVKNLDMIKKEPFYKINTDNILKIKKFLYFYIDKKSIFIYDDKKIKKVIKKYIAKYLTEFYRD